MNYKSIDSFDTFFRMGYSLEDIIEEKPSLIFPEEDPLPNFIVTDNIMAACAIYHYVKECLAHNKPVVDDDDDDDTNSHVVDTLSQCYVPGYGEVNISALSTKPLLTGSVLLLPELHVLDDECDDPQCLEIFTAFEIIAEMVARQAASPYDVTCMQLPEYELLRFGINGTTTRYDSEMDPSWLTTARTICLIRFNPNNTLITHCNEGYRYSDHMRCTGGTLQCLVGNMSSNSSNHALEFNSTIYSPIKDCYFNLREIYRRRTLNGEIVF